uniref:Tetratricopeptide repeat protein n=1 Tax=candidate division WOR-3 bacterium TaxID=2052148 RepID=A0A7V0Z4N1_UNCW3
MKGWRNNNKRNRLLIIALEGKGDVLTFIGRYDEVTDSFQKVLKYSRNSHLTLAKSKRKIADVYQKQGNYEIALGILRDAEMLLTGKSVEEWFERVELCIQRCSIYRVKGEMEKGLEQGKRGLKIVGMLSYKNLPRDLKIYAKKIESIGCNSLGAIFWTRGEYDKAINLFQKRLDISKKLGDKRGIGMACNSLGNLYSANGEYEKAIKLFQRKIEISKEIGDVQGISIGSGNLGFVYHHKGEYDKALKLYQEKLKISEEIGDIQSIAVACGGMGDVYFNQGECEKAFELFKRYLKVCKKIGDKQGIGIANGYLGSLFLELGDFKKAESYLLKSEMTLNQIKSKFYLIEPLTKIAELRILEQKVKWALKSREFADRALKLAKELNLKKEKACALLLQARILHQGLLRGIKGDKGLSGAVRGTCSAEKIGIRKPLLQDWQDAEDKFKEAIALFEELKQPFELAKAYYYYGEALKKCSVQFQLDEKEIVYLKMDATKYLQKAKEIFKRIGAKGWLKKVNELWKEVK